MRHRDVLSFSRHWHQTDLDLEWTIDEIERNDDGEIIAQHTRKIVHIQSVEPPYDVWGDACLDGRANAPQPFFSAHRLLVGRVTNRDNPAVSVAITNGSQPIKVDENCAATVNYQVQASDVCCIDAADLGLDVTASSLDGSASIGTESCRQIGATSRSRAA